ncbi:MAG: MBL fold metallo-hydrolase [Terriglobales bacterium]|jgi:glyoxylase-like metal-dependent hydrolase (beta-lactamase superfamily II)
MIDCNQDDRGTGRSMPFSRRSFLAKTSCFGALYAVAKLIPLPALGAVLESDLRLSQTPIVDKGFASVRKVGNGLYATISDPSKGNTTLCNGGFLVGKDGALLIEGFMTPVGASFQMDALRLVSQVPVKGALDTHYHFDHSRGNSFYGANGIPLWAHATAAKRIVENYAPLQGADKEAVLGPFERLIHDAKSETEKAHAQSDLNALTSIFAIASGTVLALPNHPLDPGKLPMTIDLGGVSAVLESHAGHSGTDIIVRVPEQNVVYTGDLLFSGWYPVCFDEKATISGWRETLKKFAALDKDTLFVPGHGQICGQEGIASIREVFDDIAGQAEKMYHAGVPVEEAQHRYVVPEKFKNFPVFAWGFTIGPAITKLYAEWQAK